MDKMQKPFEELKGILQYLEALGISYLPHTPELEFLFQKKSPLTEGTILALQERIKACRECSLHRIRKGPILGEYRDALKLMLVGDYPCEEDEYHGYPFSGTVGEILQKMLFSIGLRKEDFYCTLVVKCKPAVGKVPEEEDISACKRYLLKEIKLLKPKLILAMGFLSPKAFIDKPVPFNNLRGNPFPYRESMIIFTYHPSYLLKNPSVKRLLWEDLKLFRGLYEKVI
ncbi:MAG: uracil-DNA glycosylase [Thermodesulfobacteriaceae bacterium]|nr:uracil-DNA glycosylase [Thermodesulfobacteriaceae bacterium]